MQGFGLNYLCTSDAITDILGLSRDRNAVDVSLIIQELDMLVLYSQQLHPAEHLWVVTLFLQVLHQEPTCALRHLVEEQRANCKAMAKLLYKAYQHLLRPLCGISGSGEDLLLLQPAQVIVIKLQCYALTTNHSQNEPGALLSL